jgi:hypothetical protein
MKHRHSSFFVLAVCVLAVLAVPSAARAQCDTATPALTGFTFSPSSINTTAASATVNCNMTLTDALSGVANATCSFVAPDFFHRVSCSLAAPTSGTRANGVWSCAITVPRYELAGTWTAQVSANDAVGNAANLDPSLQGFASALTITSDPDTVAPALGVFSLVPGSVTVSAASQNVTCNMALTDAKSGVAQATCALQAPDSEQTVGCASAAPASGTRNNGTFSCVITVPRYADAGTWVPTVFAVDQVGNFTNPPAMPAATLTVTSVPEDITPPSLTNFDFNPKTINVGGSSQNVTCSIPVADSPAGVNSATCQFSIQTFVPPASFITQTQSCVATTPTTGTRNSGTFQCTVTFPRYSAGGLWSSSVSLNDLAGNQADFPQALQLNVLCGAADAETVIRFASKTSLTWDAVAGATQYNVYRGAQSALVDTNADHLPDAGYGTCQNSRDANLVDTAFAEPDVPTAGQGYFFLVAYKAAGEQKGLGSNSFGTARTVVAPCP